MKLLAIELFGEYKGLKDYRFDFSKSEGDVAVLIGANGSGKSQLMELIAEIFSYLERKQRKDFRVRKQLGYDFCVEYEMASSRYQGLRRFVIESRKYLRIAIYEQVAVPVDMNQGGDTVTWRLVDIAGASALDECQLPRIVGYASSLAENLQRPFMRNALQFYDVIRVRSRLKTALAQPTVDESKTLDINKRYLSRNPGIFSPDGEDEFGLFRLRETDTPIPRSLFLDYDCAALLIALLGMLEPEQRDAIWRDIPYRHPTRVILRYDLRGQATATDNAKDIKRLIEIAGPGRCIPLSPPTTEEQFELLDLEHLTADIELDFSDESVRARLREYGRESSDWFFALYKLQLLGVHGWTSETKRSLRSDNFQGHVEKPLKANLPLSAHELWMSNGERSIAFDDLSDGEVQLLLTLGAVRLFGNDETLFLFDEPETHLNPSWRTRFHLDFEKANEPNGNAQAIISSHSPFLVSSLPREAVFHFKENHGLTEMATPARETYGASFDVLIKKHFDLHATISETAVQEIRKRLSDTQSSAQEKLNWLNNSVGESMERSYLMNKLRVV